MSAAFESKLLGLNLGEISFRGSCVHTWITAGPPSLSSGPRALAGWDCQLAENIRPFPLEEVGRWVGSGLTDSRIPGESQAVPPGRR